MVEASTRLKVLVSIPAFLSGNEKPWSMPMSVRFTELSGSVEEAFDEMKPFDGRLDEDSSHDRFSQRLVPARPPYRVTFPSTTFAT
jgi:hypothetical protein